MFKATKKRPGVRKINAGRDFPSEIYLEGLSVGKTQYQNRIIKGEPRNNTTDGIATDHCPQRGFSDGDSSTGAGDIGPAGSVNIFS